jgi:hypothetical protein
MDTDTKHRPIRFENQGVFFQNGKFWTAAASEARRRFGNIPMTWQFFSKKALSPLRSASAVQKLPPEARSVSQGCLALKIPLGD